MDQMPEVKMEDIRNFVRLISWGARNYSNKLIRREFDYDYFYSEGLKSLDKCMRFFQNKLIDNPECLYLYRKAKKSDIRVAKNSETIKKLDNRLGKNVSHPILSSLAFSKYFKAALFRRFSNIRRMSFASKRRGNEISFDDWKGGLPEGFSGIEYSELVEDIASRIDNQAERMIFLIKADPPEDLCDLALLDNRRKLKVGAMRRLRTGKKNNWGERINISDKNMIDFLHTRGVSLSPTEYTLAFENVKKRVAELMGK
jgi:hypothetical protein